jgi:formate-dependent nitrite reductase cytochrome c552 subunit
MLALGACDTSDRTRTFAPPPASASAEVDIHVPAKLSSIETEELDSMGRPVRVACATCHSLRETAVVPASPAELDEFHQGLTFSHGELACASCHAAEPRRAPQLRLADGRQLPTTEAMQLCAQCHGPQHRDYKSGSHGGMNGAWDLSRGGRVRNHCVDCHDPHTPAIPAVLPEPRARDRVFRASEGDHG